MTSLPIDQVNLTAVSKLAGILQLMSDGPEEEKLSSGSGKVYADSPAEESLASLAGEDVVMPARGLVAAHHAQLQAPGHLLLPLGQLPGLRVTVGNVTLHFGESVCVFCDNNRFLAGHDRMRLLRECLRRRRKVLIV